MKRFAQIAVYVFERRESPLKTLVQRFVILIAQFIASKLDASCDGAHVLLDQGSYKEKRRKKMTAIECDERLRVEDSLFCWDRRRHLNILEFTSADQLNFPDRKSTRLNSSH